MLLQDSPQICPLPAALPWLDNKRRQEGVPSALSPPRTQAGLSLPRVAIPISISEHVALRSLAGRLAPVWVSALEHLPSACPPPPLSLSCGQPPPPPVPCCLLAAGSPSWQSLQPSLLLAVHGASAAGFPPSFPPWLPPPPFSYPPSPFTPIPCPGLCKHEGLGLPPW